MIGEPLGTGLRRLSYDEQEVERANWRRIQREIAPQIEENQRALERGMAEAHSYFISKRSSDAEEGAKP